MSIIEDELKRARDTINEFYGGVPKNNSEGGIVNERIDTIISKKKLKLDLYHASDKKFNSLQPKSLSMGNRLFKPEFVSFLTDDPDKAILWGLYKIIVHIPDIIADKDRRFKFDLRNKKIYIKDSVEYINMYADTKPMSEYVRTYFNYYKPFIYLYTFKNVPVKLIGGVGAGQLNSDEYTIPEVIVPNKIETINYDVLMRYIEFVPETRYRLCDDTIYGYGNNSIADKIVYRNGELTMQDRLLITNYFRSLPVSEQRKLADSNGYLMADKIPELLQKIKQN